MTRREQATYWGVAFLAFIAFLWAVGGVIAPFLFGMAIAYFTDPLADWLEAHGFSRVSATAIVTVAALLLAILALLVVVPVLLQQADSLIANGPSYFKALRSGVEGVLATYAPSVALSEGSFLTGMEENLRSSVQKWGGSIIKGVLSSGVALIDFLGVLFITPVVAFYLLLDWDRMVAAINQSLPRQHAPEIRGIAKDIDRVLAGFLRGQVSVCLILGTFYALALTLLGLEFGLFVGIIAGLISFIPFVGSIVGLTLSVGLALAQFWGDWLMVGAVAAVFFVGQAVEGNILTPKLVGGSVGLHPVWLIFALSVFGSLFGFAGLLVAVPVAAAIGVVTRWALERYKESMLYRGTEDTSEE